jgi:hypothetical protein
MTPDRIERIRLYVEKTRQEFLVASQNSRSNGYNSIAAEEANKAQIAKLILEDLASEAGDTDAV